MKRDRIFGLPRNVFALGLTSLFNDFSSEMVLSVLPAFFSSVLGAGAAALGLVEGIADAAANTMKIVAGKLSDKTGKRKTITLVGYWISVVSRFFYLLAGSVGAVISIRFADRLGKGTREPPRDAIISLSVARGEEGRSFGFHRTMDTTGAILGPLIAFALLYFFPGDFITVFLVAAFIGILALGGVLAVRPHAGVILPPAPKAPAPWRLSKRFLLFLTSVAILSAGSLPLALLLLSVTNVGIVLAFVPLFYALYNVSYAMFAIGAGSISDRIGPEKVIVAGHIVLVIAYLIIAEASAPLTLIFGFLALGVFSALTAGVERAYTALHTDEMHRGAAFGYFNAAIGVGAMAAGLGGGWTWQHFGPSVALFAACAIILLGLLVFTIGNGYLDERKRRRLSATPLPPPTRA